MTRSGHARGGYRIGVHLLVASDIIEFVENGQVARDQVIYDGIRYGEDVGPSPISLG